jgi:hypothetical protein
MMKAEMIMPFVNAYGLIGLPTNWQQCREINELFYESPYGQCAAYYAVWYMGKGCSRFGRIIVVM